MDTEQAIKLYAEEKHRKLSRETSRRAYWRDPDKFRQRSLDYYRAHRVEINAQRRAARAQERANKPDRTEI